MLNVSHTFVKAIARGELSVPRGGCPWGFSVPQGGCPWGAFGPLG